MKLEGPIRYRLSRVHPPEAGLFTIADDDGKDKFGHPATSTLPKLYVITVEGEDDLPPFSIPMITGILPTPTA